MRRTQTDADESERAVSPVIGVILMIAITVILAAVIATLVMDFGSGSSPGPSAAFEVDDDGNGSTVQLVTADRLDSWDAYCASGSAPSSLSEDPDAGTTVSVSCSPENVTVLGSYDGKESTMPT